MNKITKKDLVKAKKENKRGKKEMEWKKQLDKYKIETVIKNRQESMKENNNLETSLEEEQGGISITIDSIKIEKPKSLWGLFKGLFN